VYPPFKGVVEALGLANGVQLYPTGESVPLELMLITTQGLVQLIVKPLVVLGVMVMVGITAFDATETVCEVQQPLIVLQKVAV
jgi:hypothetical protein